MELLGGHRMVQLLLLLLTCSLQHLFFVSRTGGAEDRLCYPGEPMPEASCLDSREQKQENRKQLELQQEGEDDWQEVPWKELLLPPWPPGMPSTTCLPTP
mmetsp:Transcript_26881/g.61328  ORF Transcript_26881/g.61328 Transcript_26881/m.61328 type:complete len:100 (-) Transcript_26881:11-310(-)